MKKSIALLLILLCIISLTSCSDRKIDKTKPVFNTENISSVVFFKLPNPDERIEVPDEYFDEITAWLGTFKIGEKVKGDVLAPGSNSISVQIEYADGSIVKNGLSTYLIEEKMYYLESAEAPECFLNIFPLD